MQCVSILSFNESLLEFVQQDEEALHTMSFLSSFKKLFRFGSDDVNLKKRQWNKYIKKDIDPMQFWEITGNLGDGAFGTVYKVGESIIRRWYWQLFLPVAEFNMQKFITYFVFRYVYIFYVEDGLSLLCFIYFKPIQSLDA